MTPTPLYSLKAEYEIAHKLGALDYRQTRCRLLARTELVDEANLPVNIPGHFSRESFLTRRDYVTTLALQISPLLAKEQVTEILERTASLQGEVSLFSTGLLTSLPAIVAAWPLSALGARPYAGVVLGVWLLLWVGLYLYFVRDLHRAQQRTYEELLQTLQSHLDAYHLVRKLASVTRLQC